MISDLALKASAAGVNVATTLVTGEATSERNQGTVGTAERPGQTTLAWRQRLAFSETEQCGVVNERV